MEIVTGNYVYRINAGDGLILWLLRHDVDHIVINHSIFVYLGPSGYLASVYIFQGIIIVCFFCLLHT